MKATQRKLTAHQVRRTLRADKLARLRARRRLQAVPPDARPRSTAREVTLKDVIAYVRYDLDRAAVPPRVERRALDLMRHLHADEPTIIGVHPLSWMLTMARHTWVRPLEGWRAPPGCQRDKRDHLARHLLARFPVPEFLFHALTPRPAERGASSLESDWAVQALACLGCGDSLRTIVGTDAFPTPLTRRMCHEFLSAPPQVRPIVALRRVQLAAGGGDPDKLLPALLKSRLGHVHTLSSEQFWDRVIRWLCRQPDSAGLNSLRLDELLRCLELRARQGAPIRLRGRPLQAVLREVNQLALAEMRARGDGFDASGLRAMERGPWSVQEIRTPEALHAEGTTLRHCVWSYLARIIGHKSAIWSIRRAGIRVVTVEVDLKQGRIVQACGFANRPCSQPERHILSCWAVENGLSVA